MATKKKVKGISRRKAAAVGKATKRKSASRKIPKMRGPVKAGKLVRKCSRKPVRFIENAHVRDLLVELAGEKALKIAGELVEPMSDEDLAGSAKMKISEVRAVMNKLHSVGVAAYNRTRNDEGWYTYTWNLCPDRTQKIISERNVQKKAGAGKKSILADCYVCPTCFGRNCNSFAFEKAVETEFRCPECSEMLKYIEKK